MGEEIVDLINKLKEKLNSISDNTILEDIEKLDKTSKEIWKIQIDLKKRLNSFPIKDLKSQKEKITLEINSLISFLQEILILTNKK